MSELSYNIPTVNVDLVKLTPRHKPCLDCTDEQGKDSQNLQNFINKRALKNQREHLGKTYLIRRKGKNIGYLTLAASKINKDDVAQKIRPTTRDGPVYPALALLDFCIDKRLRKHGIGKEVLIWCFGLLRHLSNLVGCRYMVLFTKDAIDFYKKLDFIVGENQDQNETEFVLMYKDLFPDLKQ